MRGAWYGAAAAAAVLALGSAAAAQDEDRQRDCLPGESLEECADRLGEAFQEGEDVRTRFEPSAGPDSAPQPDGMGVQRQPTAPPEPSTAAEAAPAEGAAREERAAGRAKVEGEKDEGRVPEDVERDVREDVSNLREDLRAFSAEQGKLEKGVVKNSITTDPIGIAMGEGLNVQYMRTFGRRFTGMIGANYARANAVNGDTTTGGGVVGVDYFLVGQNNEGLRVGARAFGEGGETDVGGLDDEFVTVGVAPEVGYNYILKNGITGGVGAGLDLEVSGIAGDKDDLTGETDPYAKLIVGYSW